MVQSNALYKSIDIMQTFFFFSTADKTDFWIPNNASLYIINKNDVFYEIDIYNENIPSFVSNSDKSIIESMIINELYY